MVCGRLREIGGWRCGARRDEGVSHERVCVRVESEALL